MSDHARHHRRRATQVLVSRTQQIHNRLPRLFSGHSPAASKYEDDSAQIPAASPLALKLPPAQNGSQDPTRSLATLKQMSLDEEPCGPSNTPEPDGVALAPAPTSTPPLSSAELLSQGRELEAKFNGLMAGVAVESVGGLRSEARDFAAVGLV